MPSYAFAIGNVRMYLQIGPKTRTNRRFSKTRLDARTKAKKEDVSGETRTYGNPIRLFRVWFSRLYVGVCDAGFLQRPVSVRPSVCPVGRRSTSAAFRSLGAGSRYRSTAAGAAYRLSIDICRRPSCGCGQRHVKSLGTEAQHRLAFG